MEMPDRRQSGAVLVLALIFLLIGSFVVIPLAGLATTNLQATAPFITERQLEYAADGAMDLAIETVRYSAMDGYAGGPCGPITTTVNGQTVTVDCTSETPGASGAAGENGESRYVSFVACPGGDTSGCSGQSFLSATADYSDFTPTGVVQPGYAVRILTWEVQSANS